MTNVVFNPMLIEALSFISKNLTSEVKTTRPIPNLDSMGEKITDVKQLADVMGVSPEIAAAYALESGSDGLKADAEEVLGLGVYIAPDDAFEAVRHYAYRIAGKRLISECKRVRMVRSPTGVRRFKQNLGSIIVRDGEQPLDSIAAVKNDVPGYDKLVDKKGNSYYVGHENGTWVVRSGASKSVLYTSKLNDGGQEDALRWLNTAVGGQRTKAPSKSEDEDVEVKRVFTPVTVQRMAKQGHAFRKKDGTYSYPIENVADLKNAIQAFGRGADEDKDRLKAYIKKRARQLNSEDLIPDDWKSGMPEDVEFKKPVAAMDTSPLDHSPKKNWVEAAGQLPPYIRAIAHALIRDHGYTVDRAIATALSRIKAWIADPHTSAETKAKCVKALAQWEALRAKNKAKQIAKKA